MNLEIEVPVGVEAEIVIPEGAGEYLLEGQKYTTENKNSLVNIKSGKYNVSYVVDRPD